MNASEPVRIGIIGLGQIGKVHLQNYATIPGAQVVAVATLNPAQEEAFARSHGVTSLTSDFRELLRRDDISAVDVCLHNNLHMPVTVEALRAGKDVYCEKPMAGSYCDALAMWETARQERRRLSIQLNSLFLKEVRAARELVALGRLGRLYHARSVGFRRRMRPYVDGYGTAQFVQKNVASGGALYDMGVYHIAAMLHLLGNPAVMTVSGKTHQEIDMDPARRASSGYDVEEFATGFVRLEGNISLDILESWAANLDQFGGSVLLGSAGGVRLEPFGYFTNIGDLELNAGADLEQFLWRKDTVAGEADAYSSGQHHWIAALQGRVPLLPTAEIALNTMLISEGLYLSERLGREVTADEVAATSESSALRM